MHEGHALGAALPHRVLAAPERPVGALLRAAVVGHEDDHGVAVLVGPPQRQSHVHHGLVQRGDHALAPARLVQPPVWLVEPRIPVRDLQSLDVIGVD